MNDLLIRRRLYLAGKNDDLFDDSSSLVLEELLNDIAPNGTCPSDGEVRVFRHDLILSTVHVIFGPKMLRLPLFILFQSQKAKHSHTIMITKSLGE